MLSQLDAGKQGSYSMESANLAAHCTDPPVGPSLDEEMIQLLVETERNIGGWME
jgi:hypothetical protein